MSEALGASYANKKAQAERSRSTQIIAIKQSQREIHK